ncbi:type II toxin-antitoxin system prevent-host-death family antitoxin [Zhihengliuella sp.]|uniref:type II toxin-antitoxin system Phd/YefM family antitoxin n=1 Tax=Zhihengliuella sp. TaxID=1954483 RepID=UPI002810CB43|nr:type II toxin-antitoxin system prevent-host-death family antitoxin [Zhihengliuella sp.]
METMSITEASRAGISNLVNAAESGREIALSKHGRVVAEVISAREIEGLRRDRESLRDAALLMTRIATDSGVRTDLDSAMAAFGIDRGELEVELDAERFEH